MSLISVGLIVTIVFTALSPVFASPDDTDSQASSLFSLKETDRNTYCAGLANRLIATFNSTKIPDGYGERTIVLYPVEYGGAYIDKSNNLRVLLTKNANITTINSYRNIMLNDTDIVFEIADFPLSRLYAVQNALIAVMRNFTIDAAGISETTNRLEVNLHNSTKQNDIIEYLNNQFNDFNASCITFLGPLEFSDGIAYINPSMVNPESNNGFLGTNIPTTYWIAALTIILATIVLGACYLTLIRRRVKQQIVSEN